MSIISWNCRGVGASTTVAELKELCRSSKPSIVFLMETRAKSEKIQELHRCLKFSEYFCVEPRGTSGGLCLMWDNSVEIDIISFCSNFIHCEEVMETAVNHFREVFTSEGISQVKECLSNIPFLISNDLNQKLIAEVSDSEIKAAVDSLGSTKAPGPDGLNGLFYKSHWESVGNDICRAVRCFFSEGALPEDINETLMCLVPKIPNPECISQYRPISCANFTSKVISRIMVNRLRGDIGTLVSQNQSAFVGGRLIQDNIIVAHEVAPREAYALTRILNSYSNASGQRINMTKSGLICGRMMESRVRNQMEGIFNIGCWDSPDPSQRAWNRTKLKEVVPSNLAIKIVQTPVSWFEEEDKIYWPYSKHGSYSAYALLSEFFKAAHHNEQVSSGFIHCGFTWVQRRGNKVAHKVAQACLTRNLPLYWNSALPEWLIEQLYRDSPSPRHARQNQSRETTPVVLSRNFHTEASSLLTFTSPRVCFWEREGANGRRPWQQPPLMVARQRRTVVRAEGRTQRRSHNGGGRAQWRAALGSRGGDAAMEGDARRRPLWPPVNLKRTVKRGTSQGGHGGWEGNSRGGQNGGW
ncbi:Reverse transcriptase domain [Sesbania bispinosa]|nr:Reverse transcriptase domain [Sesbania bispinosa]